MKVQRDEEEISRRRHHLDQSVVEDRATANVQHAQADLARSEVKAMSLRHERNTERAKQLDALCTEMAMGSILEGEARARLERENLETVVRRATKDMVIQGFKATM